MIAFTSIAANLIAIGGGILVFHDSIGAASMPAPTRARAQRGTGFCSA